QQRLKVTAEEYPRLFITEAGRGALDETALLPLSGFTPTSSSEPALTRLDDEQIAAKAPQSSSQPAASGDAALMQQLKQWRREKANALKVPPYVVFHDSVLETISQQRPYTPEELSGIKGIGASKLAQFGDELLTIVQQAGTAFGAPSDLRLQIEIWRQ